MCQKLSRLHKIAFARVITDLIEADFVVEEAEMESFEEIISKNRFGISTAMLVEAKKMDFAKAVSILAELKDEACMDVLKTLRQLAMSDGTCVPQEAIQIFAIEQVLANKSKLYSVPKQVTDMPNMTVVYIENDDDTITNRQIQTNWEFILEHLRELGLEFIYIPSVANNFRQLNRSYLQKVVRYMIPSAKAERIQTICTNLCDLTTSRFCRDLLYKKLKLNLIDAKPSLLIKINESDIVEQFGDDSTERIRFSNYLKIEIGDVMVDVQNIISNYGRMINSSIDIANQQRNGKFLYYGFHRWLFDLIAYGKKLKEYRLVFDVSTHTASVYFESLDGTNEKIPLRLNPRETALYLMIAKKSLNGKGLDWREHIPKAEKQKLLEEYNGIYSYIGKSKSASEFKDRIQTNHIRNAVNATHGVANTEMFLPECVRLGTESFYRIKASEKYVKMILL